MLLVCFFYHFSDKLLCVPSFRFKHITQTIRRHYEDENKRSVRVLAIKRRDSFFRSSLIFRNLLPNIRLLFMHFFTQRVSLTSVYKFHFLFHVFMIVILLYYCSMKSNDEDKYFNISLLNNGSLEENTFQLHFLQR